MKPKPIVIALAMASLFFAVLLPPEAYPNGKFAVILCATFAFVISVVERRVSRYYILGGLAFFALLLLHGLFVSVDTYRSIEFITVLWAYYCLLGFFRYAGFEPQRPVAIAMVALSIIVSGYGLYQYFWGFDRLYDYIFYSSSDQVVKVPALTRIADRRVFSTLALPGTLWGFLVLALPFHVALWRKGQRHNIVLAASLAMLLATGFLTRSFGFLLGLAVLVISWLVLRHGRRALSNKFALGFLALVLVAGGAFYSARRGVIEGANPASLRLKNWVSAWTIFAANPMGTGLNTYGVMYPRYMLPNANETQYAHNTPLQLLSELGYPLVIAAVGMFLWAIRNRTHERYPNPSPFVALALAVWIVHNLVDINVYFGSLGALGAVLIGILLKREAVEHNAVSTRLQSVMGSVALGVVAFAALAMVAGELQHRAQAEFEENKMTKAVETLEQAKTLMPLNSSLFHDSGDILLNLYHKRHDRKYLTSATESFQRAVALSPSKAGSHIGLGLCLSSADQMDDALLHIRTALLLYPDSSYAQAIVKLMEQRRTELLAKN